MIRGGIEKGSSRAKSAHFTGKAIAEGSSLGIRQHRLEISKEFTGKVSDQWVG